MEGCFGDGMCFGFAKVERFIYRNFKGEVVFGNYYFEEGMGFGLSPMHIEDFAW